MRKKKIKVLTISDHPLSPSGVGTQAKYIIEALLQSGKFEVVSLGGAIKHDNYSSGKVQEYGDDWIIHPVNGYGNPEIVRSIIRTEKPDILWFMTDPRFWGWLWHMEDEVRSLIPMVYYHVWDNYPYPHYNYPLYQSNDLIVTISKVTDDIVATVSPEVNRIHIPHAVDTKVFKKHSPADVQAFRKNAFAKMQNYNPDRKYFFWNNRNARRKQSGTLLWWFKDFLDVVGHDNAGLIMHTDPKDKHGQDLKRILKDRGLDQGQVLLSDQKLPPGSLSLIYDMAIATINIADAEGFGLATLESLSCETPIVVSMTGGLQEQVKDENDNWFGIGIEPSSKAIIGGQDIPYIYEDRLNKQEFVDALVKMYNFSNEERCELGRKGREHVAKNYNFENYKKRWVEVMLDLHERCGSWDTRKDYERWSVEAI